MGIKYYSGLSIYRQFVIAALPKHLIGL